jgi:hypothetical protein
MRYTGGVDGRIITTNDMHTVYVPCGRYIMMTIAIMGSRGECKWE